MTIEDYLKLIEEITSEMAHFARIDDAKTYLEFKKKRDKYILEMAELVVSDSDKERKD